MKSHFQGRIQSCQEIINDLHTHRDRNSSSSSSGLSFAGIYVLQTRVINVDSSQLKEQPKIIPQHILNDPEKLHHKLQEIQQDSTAKDAYYLIPLDLSNSSNQTAKDEENPQPNLLNQLIQKTNGNSSSLQTAGASPKPLEYFMKSLRLWDKPNRWTLDQKSVNYKPLSEQEASLFQAVVESDALSIKSLIHNGVK